MITKAIFKSSLFIAILIQVFLTSYLFVVIYLINEEGRVYKFGYFSYAAFLALPVFPLSLVVVLIVKALFAYFKKK
jgi:hypothetical protein